jgi:hypothetical protein
MHAGNLDYGSDGASRDYPGPLLCRLQENMLGTKQPMDLVRNRSRGEGDMHQVFLGLFNCLGNRNRHLSRLSLTDADPTLSISYDNQRTKVEPFSTLHDFCHAVDKDNLILQA